MADQRKNPKSYREAQLAARKAAGSLSLKAAQEIEKAIELFLQRLQAELTSIKGLTEDSSYQDRLRAAETSVDIAKTMKERMQQLITTSINENRDAAFNDVLNIWSEAGLIAGQAQGLDDSLMAPIHSPSITLAGVYEGLGGAAQTWKTLTAKYAGAAADDVNKLVRTALLEGMSPKELSRRLRPYVIGSEPFTKAFAGSPITDKMLADPAFTQAARKLAYNTDRIAFSEIHNARAEAEVQHFAADPLVKAVAWRLSPNRGTQKTPDQCDLLAHNDYYGLGPGVYPVAKVPLPPHPFDRCERVPILRSPAEAANMKPNPQPVKHAKQSSLPNGCL